MSESTSDLGRCRGAQCDMPLVADGTRPIPPGHREHAGRRLCTICYGRALRAGTRDQHPRLRYSASEVAARWLELQRAGHTPRSAAAELGLSPRGFNAALARASRAPFDPDTRDEGEETS